MNRNKTLDAVERHLTSPAEIFIPYPMVSDSCNCNKPTVYSDSKPYESSSKRITVNPPPFNLLFITNLFNIL